MDQPAAVSNLIIAFYSGNPNNQACLSGVLSFNVLFAFTSGSFSALLAEIQCHEKTLSKPCTNCSSVVLRGASVNRALRGVTRSFREQILQGYRFAVR